MEISDLIKRCVRIFYISRKPTDDEFKEVAKVTAIGMVVIGVIGMIISSLFAAF